MTSGKKTICSTLFTSLQNTPELRSPLRKWSCLIPEKLKLYSKDLVYLIGVSGWFLNFMYKKYNFFRLQMIGLNRRVHSVQFSSVTQSCVTLCDPMNCSTPGLPVHHKLPELTQTHVHRVSDAIQPCHPLLPSSPPAHNHSLHQSLFQ